MSTVEPTWTGRPCPWCGGDGYHNDYLVSVGMTACQECGIALPGEAWDVFSDAMALARAVERLGHDLDTDNIELSVWESLAGVTAAITKMRYTATVPIHQVGQQDSLAAALIALAGEVRE